MRAVDTMTRVTLSPSELCELLGLDPKRFICVENGHWEPDPAGRLRFVRGVEVILEKADADHRHVPAAHHR